LTIKYRKGEKNEEELEKFNLREDVVPDPNSDKSIFPLQKLHLSAGNGT
jgi:hypothetical protein